MEPVLRPVLPAPKAAEALGVCEQTIRNLFHGREIEGYTVGRRILVFVDSLAAYQSRNSNQTVPALPIPEPEAEQRLVPMLRPRRRRGVPDYDRHLQQYRRDREGP
jgi:hypothetical protein